MRQEVTYLSICLWFLQWSISRKEYCAYCAWWQWCNIHFARKTESSTPRNSFVSSIVIQIQCGRCEKILNDFRINIFISEEMILQIAAAIFKILSKIFEIKPSFQWLMDTIEIKFKLFSSVIPSLPPSLPPTISNQSDFYSSRSSIIIVLIQWVNE